MGLFDKLKKTPEQEAKYQARIAGIKAKREERLSNIKAKRSSQLMADSVIVDRADLIMPLKDRGEKLLNQNLSNDENVLVKLQGEFGQALVLTNKRLYVVKWGMQANQTFGGKCIAYEYRNITALEIRKKMVTRYVQILTPATQSNISTSVWDKDINGNNATASDSVVTYNNDKKKDALFQEAINLGRQFMNQAHVATASTQTDEVDKLERLAKLKERGLITQEEYQAKKRQLLEL